MARKKKTKSSESTNSKTAFDQLNKKEKDFYLAYLKLNNITKAYGLISPRSTYNTCATEGHKYLKRPKIQAALKEHYNALWESKEDKIGEMFEDLYKASKADIHDVVELDSGYLNFRNFDEVDTSVIQEVGQSVSHTPSGENIKNSIKLVDKQKARSEMLRVLQMIKDKIEFDGTIEVIPPDRPETLPDDKNKK